MFVTCQNRAVQTYDHLYIDAVLMTSYWKLSKDTAPMAIRGLSDNAHRR